MKTLYHFIIIVVIIILIIPVSLAQKLSSYQCKWHPAIVINQEEDLINQMQLEEKSRLLFLVSNDDQKLYIELITADRGTIDKIMRYGMTTWFNPEAKHKKAKGIEFPLSSEGKQEPGLMREQGSGRKDMRVAMMAAKNREMVLIGFGGKDERRLTDPSQDPFFRGTIEMMEGSRLRISLAVPLEKLDRNDVSSFSNPFSLGFETGYMDVTGQGMPTGDGQPQGGMHGGGGPPHGDGPSGSIGSSSGQQERPDIGKLANPTRLWIRQVFLSKSPD